MKEDLKLSLEAHYFHCLRTLKDEDVLLQYQNQEGQRYRLTYLRDSFDFQKQKNVFVAGEKSAPFIPFHRFSDPDEAWRFMTQHEEWYLRYKPVWMKPGERLSNALYAREVIHTANRIRFTPQIDWPKFKAIAKWSNLLYAPEIDQNEMLQICPNCMAKVSFFPRYPTYICRDCISLITDQKGRKVSFGNTSFSGGCEGYYTDTREKYADNICYIAGKKFVAGEARFGGIVVELWEKKPF